MKNNFRVSEVLAVLSMLLRQRMAEWVLGRMAEWVPENITENLLLSLRSNRSGLNVRTLAWGGQNGRGVATDRRDLRGGQRTLRN
jgi:hypothetical protein